MSVKRRATNDLNHENWDQDEKDEEETGTFKTAPEEVLEKRIIRTAKRRTQNVGDEIKKPVFSGFSGFKKTQPSSFDFLANLTNGSKIKNSLPSPSDNSTQPQGISKSFGNISSSSIFTSASSNITNPTFGNLPIVSSSMFGISSSTATTSVFGTPSSTITTSVFGAPISAAVTSALGTTPSTAISSVFGAPPSTTVASVFKMPTAVSSVFGSPSTSTSVFGALTATASKADSTVNENPFKTQEVSSLVKSSFNTKPEVSSPKVSSTIFGVASSSFNNNKSVVTSSISSPLQIKSTTNPSQISNTTETKINERNDTKPDSEKIQDKKLIYYSKLKGLNESVSEWIKKHVEETPLCILTPIFKDYEGYLKEIQEEYDDKKEVTEENITKKVLDPTPQVKSPSSTSNLLTLPTTPISNKSSKSVFGTSTQSTTQSPNFSFGFTSSPGTNTTSSGFSFGVSSTQSTTTTTSPFAISNSASNTNGKAPFSFGSEKPFSFNSNIQVQCKTEKTSENAEEEDEPPKVEFTPVVEENSVIDKRCKIFVRKDGNFVDNGVGTLYIKKIENSKKYQLLVRANTNLGNVLLNLILSSTIPIQRMGKNNVMLVCVPTPEAKPPPVPILIRVKTAEEADDLLNTLNKYKV